MIDLLHSCFAEYAWNVRPIIIMQHVQHFVVHVTIDLDIIPAAKKGIKCVWPVGKELIVKKVRAKHLFISFLFCHYKLSTDRHNLCAQINVRSFVNKYFFLILFLSMSWQLFANVAAIRCMVNAISLVNASK